MTLLNGHWRSGEACAFGQGQRGAYRLDTNQFVTNEQAENRVSAEDYAGALLDEMEQPRFICQRFTAAYEQPYFPGAGKPKDGTSVKGCHLPDIFSGK